MVRVLELVHEHLGIAPTHVGQDVGIGTQQLDRSLNQPTEVHQPAPAQLPVPHTVRQGPFARLRDLLRRERARRRLGFSSVCLRPSGPTVGRLRARFLAGRRHWRHGLHQRQVVRRRQQPVPRPREIGEQSAQVRRWTAQRAVVIQRQCAEQFLHQEEGVGLVEDAEVRLECRLVRRMGYARRILAQERGGERVDRHDWHALAWQSAALQALAHLARRAVGERQRQDLLRWDVALLDQVGDAPYQRRRLAGARAGHDQRRSRRAGGLSLPIIEPVNQLDRDRWRRLAPSLAMAPDCQCLQADELAPGRHR